MKNIKTILKLAGLCAALTVICLLAGCFSAVDDTVSGAGIPAGKGTVLLNIGGSDGRTAFPAMTGISYAVTCTMGGTEQTATASKNTFSVELVPGTWTIKVEAKNSGSATIAEGTTEVLVKAGKTTGANIVLTAVEPSGAETGTLAWSADFPNGLDSAALAYSGTAEGSVDLLDAGISVTGTKRSGNLVLKPGVYLVTVNLANGAKKAGDAAIVYIYDGLTTTIDWVFTADSLVEFNPLALSVDINASSGITVNSAALTLSGNGGMVAQSLDFAKGSGNTWTVTTSIPETATTLSWSLVITTARGTLTAITGSGAAAASINLSAVNIYTLTASVGENGSLSVNGVKYTATLEFLGGTSVTLTPSPDGGFELDSMTAGGAPVSSPYTVNADTALVVTFKAGVALDPNLIWEWNYEADGKPNMATIANSSTGTLPGRGIVKDSDGVNISDKLPIAIVSVGSGANANLTFDDTRKGIYLDGRTSTNTAVIVIGTNTLSPASTPGTFAAGPIFTTGTSPDGVFDFLNNNTNGIQISFGFEVLTNGAGTRAFQVILNNNTSTATNTPLNGFNNTGAAQYWGRVLNWAPVNSTAQPTSASSGSGAAWDSTNKVLTCSSIKLSGFNVGTGGGANTALLEKAFFQVLNNGATGGNGGAEVLIKSIKIEYLP